MPYPNYLMMLIAFGPMILAGLLLLFLLYLALRLVRAMEAIASALRDQRDRFERLAAAVERLTSRPAERNP